MKTVFRVQLTMLILGTIRYTPLEHCVGWVKRFICSTFVGVADTGKPQNFEFAGNKRTQHNRAEATRLTLLTIFAIRRAKWIPLLVFLLCVFVKPGASVSSTSSPANEPEVFPRIIQYGYSLKNIKNKVLPQAEMWCYAPVSTTSFQYFLSLDTSHSYEMIEDGFGNQILHFTFSDIPPFSTKIIHIKSNLEFHSKPKPVESENIQFFLQPEQFIQSDHPEIMQLAKKLNAKDELQTVSNIFNWVANEITYIGYVKNARGALYALQRKKGDCTEFADLFVALCRANDIAARAIGGYLCPGNCIVKPEGYHNWAEFYHDGAWRIADPQKKVFMENESHYVAMKVMGKLPGHQLEDFQRFRVIGEGLKVRMN